MINKAYFYDNNGNKCYANISLESSILTIVAHNNDNDEEIGKIELLIDDRVYLSEIKCNRCFYRLGIGTALIDIFEYLYKDYTGIVYGKYCPFNVELNTTENDEVGKAFYIKNGYNIVTKKYFKEHQELYPNLKLEDFAHTSRIFDFSLIYKRNIQKDEYRFKEVDNELIEKQKVKVLE